MTNSPHCLDESLDPLNAQPFAIDSEHDNTTGNENYEDDLTATDEDNFNEAVRAVGHGDSP